MLREKFARSYRRRIEDATRERVRTTVAQVLIYIVFIFVVAAAVISVRAATGFQQWLPTAAILISIASFALQQREALGQNQRMMRLEGLLSTASIADFPDHIEEITRLAKDAHDDFYCMVDCIDYASFSDPEGHERLEQAIEEGLTKRGVRVRMLISGGPAAITRTSPLFGLSWEKLQQMPEFNEYFERHYRGRPRSETAAAFTQLLLDQQKVFERQLRDRGADIRQVQGESLSHFFWIADNREAVFLWLASAPDRSLNPIARATRC